MRDDLPGNDLSTPQVRQALADELCGQLDAPGIEIHAAQRLSGGAIQENWALDVSVAGGRHAGRHAWVLRTDAPSAVSASLGRAQEYAVLSRVAAAGVQVPTPLLLVPQSQALGRPFFLMQRLYGLASGHLLTGKQAVANPDALLGDLAASLARLHSITPAQADLAFLQPSQQAPAAAAIGQYRAYLDSLQEPQPVLEWGLRWCERHMPEAQADRLIHRDFRTGNYLVEDGRLSGILDWEFAGFGDPREDLGWFSARCWRFAAPGCEAGGIGSLERFLQAYHEAGGQPLAVADITYWQVMAHLRWGVIALQQAQRHLSGQERSLELALTGRLLPELEIEILHLTQEPPR